MNKQVTIVIGVPINEKGEILIAKRIDPNLSAADNKWQFVGGKIEFGEDPEDAMVREVKEESGLDVEVIKLLPKIFVNNWKKGDEIHQTFILSYACKIIGGELVSPEQGNKIAELKFIDPGTIREHDTLPKCNEITDLILETHAT